MKNEDIVIGKRVRERDRKREKDRKRWKDCVWERERKKVCERDREGKCFFFVCMCVRERESERPIERE